MPNDFDDTGNKLGATATRTAAALLHALGDGGVVLRLLIPATRSNDDLGMAGPLTEDVEFSPAALQALQSLEDGTACYEASLAAEAVEEEVEKRGLETPEALFASVLGIVVGERLLQLVSVTPRRCGGAIYLYRLEARG